MTFGNANLALAWHPERLTPRWSVVAFWAIELTGASHLSPDGTLHRFGPVADADTIVHLARATNNTATEVADRFQRGVQCLTFIERGQIATACWASIRAEWVGELESWFRPAPGEAYVWDCLTQQDLRGRGLYPRLLRSIVVELRANGCERAWIATEWRNWRSEIGVSRAGFRPVGAAVAVRAGPLHWHTIIPDPDAPEHLIGALEKGLALSNNDEAA